MSGLDGWLEVTSQENAANDVRVFRKEQPSEMLRAHLGLRQELARLVAAHPGNAVACEVAELLERTKW